MTEGLGEKLVCSMITISEIATLINSSSIEMILCHDCKQQKCQDIIYMNFLIVICSVNMISVNVAVLQIENIIHAKS